MYKINRNEREVYNCHNGIKDFNCGECGFTNECSPKKFSEVLEDVNSKIDKMKKAATTKINKMNIDELEEFIKYKKK